MPQIFPEKANRVPLQLAIGLAVGAVVAVGLIWYYFSPEYTDVGYQPEQPIPFSHALHAGELEMDCRYCHAQVEKAAAFAVRYYNDFVKPGKVFRAPDDKERAALEDLLTRLKSWDGGLDAEELQSMVFAVGKEHGFEPLRDWFKALYEVLLGASQGPRFGGFIALYGVDETIALIEDGLAGKLG